MQNESSYEVISVGAHPDDIEVGTGGVLIDLAQRGYRTGIVILTQGEMGTGGTIDIRAREVRDAAAILGTDILASFDWGDTRLEDTYQHRLDLARIIRAARPKILLAPYPHVGHGRRQSHPDHVASGIIAANATNLAALKKADLEGEPHRVERIFNYFLPPRVTPNFIVDITAHFDRWIQALSAHKSQFLNPEKSRDYIEHLTAMARSFGLQAGCKYGQGFCAVEPILIGDIMTLTQPDDHQVL
ncbi:MAG: bacillithiol biosynthesis deacetylase BshB1 [candidate division Zixibacteria bacterium]|nr:bacillithiol biosynthesis deacetylase BshB1 [candidate division Zixibacteria bacterium]